MDSPSASPRLVHKRLSEDDDIDNSSLLLSQRAHSIKSLYIKALLIVILSSAFSALVFSTIPLWRPIGVHMLHKLWDILRFLVLTTSIGLGIMNSKLWRGNDTDRDARDTVSSNGGTEDSVSSKVPFVGMFYSELQPSDSFDVKEPDMGENGFTRRTESENDRAAGVNATVLAAMATADDENKSKSEIISKLVNDTISSVPSTMLSNTHVASDTEHDSNNVSVVEEPSVNSLPSVHDNMKVAPTKGNSRLPKAVSDDLGLGTIMIGNEQAKHGGKVIHRRGNSLESPITELPIHQEGSVRKHRDVHPAPADYRRREVDASGERSSSSRKVPSSASKASDHVNRQLNESSNSNLVSASSSTSTSKHSRSRSAYDFNELLVHEQRPRSKPGATSQLARRRNVSLSCDLDKEHTVGGVPAWLGGLSSPPVPPPLIDSFGGDANRGVLSSRQDESSLRKAYTESLAPWRVATIAMPVNIPQKEDTDTSKIDKSKMKPTTLKEKKKALVKENTGVITPPSSPSTPNSFTGSPSPRELNKKVDAFIARFHERMRLQRLESLERSRQ